MKSKLRSRPQMIAVMLALLAVLAFDSAQAAVTSTATITQPATFDDLVTPVEVTAVTQEMKAIAPDEIAFSPPAATTVDFGSVYTATDVGWTATKQAASGGILDAATFTNPVDGELEIDSGPPIEAVTGAVGVTYVVPTMAAG